MEKEIKKTKKTFRFDKKNVDFNNFHNGAYNFQHLKKKKRKRCLYCIIRNIKIDTFFLKKEKVTFKDLILIIFKRRKMIFRSHSGFLTINTSNNIFFEKSRPNESSKSFFLLS